MLFTFENIAFSPGISRWWCVCGEHTFESRQVTEGMLRYVVWLLAELSDSLFRCALRRTVCDPRGVYCLRRVICDPRSLT